MLFSRLYATVGASCSWRFRLPAWWLHLRCCASSRGAFRAVLAVFMLWGCCGTAFNVAFQAELIKGVEEDESSVAMSIFSGLFNFGIGAGSALGGVVVTSVSIEAIGLVGAVVVTACWVVTVAVLFRLMRARAVGGCARCQEWSYRPLRLFIATCRRSTAVPELSWRSGILSQAKV